MSTRVFAACTISALLWTATAQAASITNRDEKDHKVTIIEGDVKRDLVLKPSEAIEGVCESSCVVRLNDSENDEYELEGPDVVSIEEGFLYYDGPEAPAAPGSGAAGEPSQPK